MIERNAAAKVVQFIGTYLLDRSVGSLLMSQTGYGIGSTFDA
jgi:hypothetical protein